MSSSNDKQFKIGDAKKSTVSRKSDGQFVEVKRDSVIDHVEKGKVPPQSLSGRNK